MAGENPDQQYNESISRIILEKTGKTRLNRASLRTVPVAGLRDVCDAVGIEHDSLTKPEIICLLLDAGELNVSGRPSSVVKIEPHDGAPSQDTGIDTRRSAPANSGQAIGPTLTRRSLKPGKATRANPRRGSARSQELEPVSISEPNRRRSPATNAWGTEIKGGEDFTQSLVEDLVQHNSAGGAACTAYVGDQVNQSQAIETADVEGNAEADCRGCDQTPAASIDREGSEEAKTSQPDALKEPEGWGGHALHPATHKQDNPNSREQRRNQDISFQGQSVDGAESDATLPSPADEPVSAGGNDYNAHPTICIGLDRSTAASKGAQQGVSHAEAVKGRLATKSSAAELWQGQTNQGSLSLQAANNLHQQQLEEDGNEVVASDMDNKASNVTSMQGGADEGNQVSTGAGTKRTKALIVWDAGNGENNGPTFQEGVQSCYGRGMFDQVLRASEQGMLRALEGAHLIPCTDNYTSLCMRMAVPGIYRVALIQLICADGTGA